MPLSVYPELRRGVLLCIDDDEAVLECEKSFLESFGYTVLTAPSGSKGLELAALYPFDVVIVDYLMPEMTGREVALKMRKLRPQAPIIMLSAAVDVPEEALDLVDAFIAKDRLASQLLPAIAQLQDVDSDVMYIARRSSMA
jgi:CheY-like chemotaxis protein